MVTQPEILEYEKSLPPEERFPEDLDDFFIYTGENGDDTMNEFCNTILDWSERIQQYYKGCEERARGFKLTPEEEEAFAHADCCYMCKRKFAEIQQTAVKITDFDYFTSKFLGAACTDCYEGRKPSKHFIPLVFHNAKGYDMHYVLKTITKGCFGCTFEGIPMNGEKLMSLTIKKETKVQDKTGNQHVVKHMCDIRIIDSLLFLLMALEKLTDIVKEKHPDELIKAFPITFRTFMKEKIRGYERAINGKNVRFAYTEEQVEAVLQKNLYPYLWFNSFEKFNLPIQELVRLVQEDEYEYFTDTPNDKFKQGFAKKKGKFFEILGKLPPMEKVMEWANIYLTNDVTQLCDIMETFRNIIHASHGLDPYYYYGGPSLSWDAFLLQLTTETPQYCPELFSAGEMNKLCFFKQCIRGGCSGVSKRYSKANNKFVKTMMAAAADKKPKKYIIYLDANNLYGWGMKQPLPYGDFKWFTEEELAWYNDPSRTSDEIIAKLRADEEGAQERYDDEGELIEENKRGAFIECKLHIPDELHDLFNSYPPAPERSKVYASDISPFSTAINKTTNCKVNSSTPLLIQTVRDKDHYFVHSKNLQLYLQLGIKLEKVYKGISFKQAKFMEPYIDKNTRLRVSGKSQFEKILYKFMNNSIYGKTFENPGKRANLKFINGREKYYQVVSKTGFVGAVFQQDDFMIAKILHESIYYAKPLYLGAAITEYAKYLMFDFYYNVLIPFYGDYHRVTLLFTDTDSLMLEIETEDVYADIAEINRRYDCPIDCSTFDKEVIERYNIPHHGDGVIGKFKSETGSNPIYRFAGLRSKMYAYELYKDYINEDLSLEERCAKKAKGVPKASLQTLNMNAYLDCLFGTHDEDEVDKIAEENKPIHLEDVEKIRQEISTRGIRSFSHKLYSIATKKYGLSCNDTKRFILWNNVDTLAYGHKDIPKIIEEQMKEYDTEDN